MAALAQPKPEARYLRFDSFDSDYYNGWDLTSAMHPQTILAYAYNDRPLMIEPRRAAPAVLSDQARLQADQVSDRDDFTRERPGGYWEDQGYPWLGGI